MKNFDVVIYINTKLWHYLYYVAFVITHFIMIKYKAIPRDQYKHSRNT